MSDVQPPVPEPPRRSVIVGKMARRMCDEHFGTGPLAELRRLDPNARLSEPALHRLLAWSEMPDGWLTGEGLRSWALVIHCLALAAPDNLLGEDRLGTALHNAGFGEKRFVNLLDANAAELCDRLPRAVRFLVHRGGRVHAPQIADLVLIPLSSDRFDEFRRRVAGDYYRAEYKASQVEATTAV